MAENIEDPNWESKYKQLLIEFNKIENIHEELKQENFILKRELSREKETNKFVSDELEIQEAKYSKDLSDAQREWVERFERMTNELTSLKEMNRLLEERNVQLCETIEGEKLVNVCKCASEKSIQNISLEESHFMELAELKEKCTKLEMELHQTVGKFEATIQENKDLVEKIDHLESSLEFKRTEIQEKREQEEVLQEKIMELSMELNNLRMQPNDQCNKKGNSLFAEVDDQRQKFRKLLNDQNDQYKQMKRAYQDGQLEIRRLRRENNEILEEMESCKELFKSSESMYKQGLLDKIDVLEQVRENLQNKVSVLEEAIQEGSSTNWVNTMLSYCRNETKTLKEKLFTCLKEKSAIEENLLRSQQECARFKFEASELKTKLRSSTSNASSDQDTLMDLVNNDDVDDSVQDFLKELNETETEKPKESHPIIYREPNYQSINVLHEKVENIVQVKKTEKPKKATIVVKKIVIPPRASKK